MLMRCLRDRAVCVPQDVILIFAYMLPEQSMQNGNLTDHSRGQAFLCNTYS